MNSNKILLIFFLSLLLSYYASASPLIFSNSFEMPEGSIEFVSDESVLFTQVGDNTSFEVIVKDYQGNVIDTGDVQWSLSSSTNLSVSNSQSRTTTIDANSFSVNTVIVTAYHPGANATGQANIILADLNEKTKNVLDADVISGVTPLTGNQTTVVLHKNARTENILAGDYVISGQNTGLLITVDAVSIDATEVTITASPATMVQVFDEFRFSGVSQVTKYHAEVSAIDNTIKVYSQKNGQLIQQKSFYDAFSCELSAGGAVNFTLTEASMDFDFDVKLEPTIDIGLITGFESFSLISTTTAKAAATTGALIFDSSITGSVKCKVTLDQLSSKPFLVKLVSFQLAVTPELGFVIAANITGPSASISGPAGIITANSSQGVKYTPVNGWEYIESENYDYNFDTLSGDFSSDLNYNISAELYALANIQLKVNFGLPPLGLSLGDISFMEIKAAEKLSLSIASPFDPADLNYTGPNADLTGTFKITPKVQLSEENFVEFMKKMGVDATFDIAFEPLVDITTEHWKSPVAVISARDSGDNVNISISIGNYLEDGTTFAVNNLNNGTFSLLYENLNTLTGSISSGRGSVLWTSPTNNQIFYPRIETDALSRLLPYAGEPTTVISGYTKLDANGNDLPNSATSWTCVRHHTTGLIWEVKTTDGGIHDASNAYRWGGVTSLGDDNGDHFTDWDSLVNGSNSAGFCGGSNWRVPTIEELETIVSCSNGDPLIEDDPDLISYGRLIGCPNGQIGLTINAIFFPTSIYIPLDWSASPYAFVTSRAWFVNFFSGHSYGDIRSSSFKGVRLVRL